MLNNPEVALEDALGRHQERIAAAQRRRLVAQVRRAAKEKEALVSDRPQSFAGPSDGSTQTGIDADLAHWLIRVGGVVAQYSAAELDRRRRRLALGVLVDELLSAARESGACVPSNTDRDDPAAVVLRTLGRLAASTAGQSIPISDLRAEMLEAVLDNLIGSRHVRIAPRRPWHLLHLSTSSRKLRAG